MKLRAIDVLIPAAVLTATFVGGRVLLQGEERPDLGPGVQEGRELLVLVVGNSTCGACRLPEFAPAIKKMTSILGERAAERSAVFAAIGVSMDTDLRAGSKFLRSLAAFDEEIVGRNWLNSAAVSYIWRDIPGPAVLPQVIVLERDVKMADEAILVSADQLLARLVGVQSIAEWVDEGSPLDFE